MALIALASASGAPGVTTTALALTLLWPRPVLLVEADPHGGSAVLAGYLRGAVAPQGRSLLGLARAQRQGRLQAAVAENTIALDDAGRRHLLPAIPQPEQASSLVALWHPLAALLPNLSDENGHDVDVIVDAGRLGAAYGPDPLLHAADVVLLCLRTQLPAVAAASARAGALAQALTTTGRATEATQTTAQAGAPDAVEEAGAARGLRLALVLLGEGRPYTGSEIEEVTGAPVIASLTWDPPAADVLATGTARPRRFEQGSYVRSCAALTDALQRRLAGTREPALTGGASRG